MRRSNVAGLLGSLALGLVGASGPGCKRTRPADGHAIPAKGSSASESAEVEVRRVPAPSMRPLRIPGLPATKVTEPRPDSPLWSTCADGFSPSSTPEADVMRLGMVCGPVNGLTLLRTFRGAVDENQPPSTGGHRWDAERGDCFRVFAVGEANIEDLEMEVSRPHGAGVVLENQNRRWVLVAGDRPFCSSEPGEFVARVSTHGGRGQYALSVWRGAKMQKAK